MRLHENNVLGLFLYAWGYHDALAGRPVASLLATPQSPLDHLIGDLVGRSQENRWFVFEFKRERTGFAAEIKDKQARSRLLDALEGDPELAELSAHAHFACWADDEMAIQQYVVAIDDPYFQQGLPSNTVFSSRVRPFPVVYNNLTEANAERSPYRPQELYWHGTGVPGQGMYRYLEAMLAAFPATVDPSSEVNALFGFWNPASGQATLVRSDYMGILAAFDRARKAIKSTLPPTKSPFV